VGTFLKILVTFEIIDLSTSDWAKGRGKVPLIEPGQSSSPAGLGQGILTIVR